MGRHRWRGAGSSRHLHHPLHLRFGLGSIHGFALVLCKSIGSDLRHYRRYLVDRDAMAVVRYRRLRGGRLRTKWVGIRIDEVFFRDTAHGFLAWALATVLMAAFFAIATAAVTAAPEATAGVATVTPEAAEQARRAAASFSFFTALSLLIGAFIGGVTGAIGGHHRDDN